MRRAAVVLVFVLVFTGCAHRATPPAQPTTVPAPVASSSAPGATREPARPAPVGAAAPRRDSAFATPPRPAPVDSAAILRDIVRGAARVFGDSAPATTSEHTSPAWDIDVHSYETQAKVKHYLEVFSGSARDRITDRLRRGTRFEPMIRTAMRNGGLPEDLYYMALIESGFDPNAYSKAAAVGMWQFMTSTARGLGLRVDWWIDERRDPVVSTVGAVRFIRDLQAQFGSLYLAAAAYNGGPGRVARSLTRYAGERQDAQGDDLFFALADRSYLRSETREYVPQLIAAALIAKDPKRYGMEISVDPPFVYDSVRVGPSLSLAAIAQAAGVSIADVQEFNPQILRGMTPPKDSILVRIPRGSAHSFDAAFGAIPDSERVGAVTHTSKVGQSMASVAKTYHLTTKQLTAYNPKVQRTKSGNLVAGQPLIVPSVATVNASAPVPDPAIERYPPSGAGGVHVVRRGETLGGIAKLYGLSTARLMELNGLKRDLIIAGQTLVISSRPSARPAAKSAAKAPSRPR